MWYDYLFWLVPHFIYCTICVIALCSKISLVMKPFMNEEVHYKLHCSGCHVSPHYVELISNKAALVFLAILHPISLS